MRQVKDIPNFRPNKIEVVRNKKEFEEMKDTLCVMARSRPADKYLLVSALRE